MIGPKCSVLNIVGPIAVPVLQHVRKHGPGSAAFNRNGGRISVGPLRLTEALLLYQITDSVTSDTP